MTIKTINFTQHAATDAQKARGVVDLEGPVRVALLGALTFDTLPTAEQVKFRAQYLKDMMHRFDPDLTGEVQFMVGGAPYLMAALAEWAPVFNMVFAYTERVSKEVHNPDGTVVKTNVFEHKGFVPMPYVKTN